MRIAVTGGRGRLGPAVVAAALAAGHEVVEIDRTEPPPRPDGIPPGLTRLVADVCSYEQLRDAAQECTALVHLAAHSNPDGRAAHHTHDNNVVGSYHALNVAAQRGMTHVCLASSVNATGGYYSRAARYDYFPVDEQHPTYNEDPYSLSKWIAEAQADSVARRHPSLTITSLRLHAIVADVDEHRASLDRLADPAAAAVRQLWGYTSQPAAVSACLLALSATFTGHEVCYVVAPRTAFDTPSAQLHRTYYPQVPLRRQLPGTTGFFDCAKATRLLGWQHG